jgi:hypothetical protein
MDLKPVKARRIIKPKKEDGPDWKFPYAHRAYIEKLREYFRTAPKSGGFRCQTRAQTHVLSNKESLRIRREEGTNWPSVPPEHRAQAEFHFHRRVAEKTREQGYITPGQVRSIRMNVVRFARWVLPRAGKSWQSSRQNLFKRMYHKKKLCGFSITSGKPNNNARRTSNLYLLPNPKCLMGGEV